MPRDAFGNLVPGNNSNLIKPVNASAAATSLLGTQRALANPGAAMRNPAATAALQRANAGVVRPPSPDRYAEATVPLAAVDVARQRQAAVNESNRAAQILLAQQQQAAMQQQQAAAAAPQQQMRPRGFGTFTG